MRCLIKRSNSGFILLGTALAIFLILSLFSIFLLRIIVNENMVAGFNLLDIRARNLSQSGLEHGLELFKANGTPFIAPVSRNFNNGSYNITFDPSYNENNTALPYSHYAMLKSSASIDDVERNTRVFFSSYPNAFNLAFFGEKDGIINYSLSFDGANDYVHVQDLSSFSTVTVSFWGKHNGADATYDRFIGNTGHKLNIAKNGGGQLKVYTPAIGWQNVNHVLSENVWTYITITSNGTTLIVYVNGSEVSSFGQSNLNISDSDDWYFASHHGPGEYGNISMDEIGIWDTALIESEITTIYNSGTSFDLLSNIGSYQSSGNLKGYWKFNEGSGDIAYDQTNNGNDGTIYGATWELISNQTTGTFSQSGGIINGDIYFNGDLTSVNLSENNIAYTSTGVGGAQHPQPLPDIPLHNSDYFTTLLSTLPEGGGTGDGDGDGGSEPDPCPIVDFENGAAGWTEGTISGINTWNISNSAGNGANLGSKAYGAPNSGSSGMEHSYIQSPVFDASAGGNLIFDTWMCNETGYYDREHVKISYNGGSSWQTLVNYTESFWNTQSQWITHTVNIPASSGTANTKIRFEYDTIDGCCGCSGGWFVDNIQFPPTGGCEQTGSEETSGGGSVEGAFTLQHGENTNNSTRSWNFNLSGDAESDDQIIVTQIWVRGDFSGSNEYLSNVTIGGHNFGTMYGAGDDGTWDLEFSGSQNVNMSGTSVSASVYPSSAINYTPGGASYWWEIKVEFYQEPEEETDGGSSVLTLNSSNITLYNEYVDSTIQNSNDIIFNNCTVNGPGKILASGDITFNSTTLSGNIEIISNGQISVDNGSTLGTGISSLNSSVILYCTAGFSTDNSTIYGLSINTSGTTSISNNTNFYGAIYSLAQTCNVSGSSSIVGSLVSAYGISLSSSTISKGSLPPIFGTPYGFQSMIIPGSYLEY